MKKIDLGSDYYDDSKLSAIIHNYDRDILYRSVLESLYNNQVLLFYIKAGGERKEYKQEKTLSNGHLILANVVKKQIITRSIGPSKKELEKMSRALGLSFYNDNVRDANSNINYDYVYVKDPRQVIQTYKGVIANSGEQIKELIKYNDIVKKMAKYIYEHHLTFSKNKDNNSFILVDRAGIYGIENFNRFNFADYGYEELLTADDINGVFLAAYNYMLNNYENRGKSIDWYPLAYDYTSSGAFLLHTNERKRELKKWY